MKDGEIVNFVKPAELQDKYSGEIAKWIIDQAKVVDDIADEDLEAVFKELVESICNAIKDPKSVRLEVNHPTPEMVAVDLALLKITKLLSDEEKFNKIEAILGKKPREYMKIKISKVAGPKQLSKYQLVAEKPPGPPKRSVKKKSDKRV